MVVKSVGHLNYTHITELRVQRLELPIVCLFCAEQIVSCRHCHKPKDLPITTCAACGACYHDDCLPRLNTRLVKACCAGLVEGGDPDLDGVAERRRTDCALAVSAIRVDARTAFLDARRGLLIDSVDSEVDMSGSDTLDALGTILAGQKSLEAVVARQGARLEELLLATNARINEALAAVSANEQRITQLLEDHERLKTQVVTVRPSTELRVHGVPISVPHDTPEALAVTFKALLALLGSTDSVQDVQEYRFFGNDPAPRRDSTQQAVRTFSFVVTFKQPITRNYILQRKYKHGLIKYADIQQGGPDAEIRLYELLPGPAYRLFQAAKERGRERKYASVWARDGRVFACKSVGFEPIQLVTEADLEKLV
uniref:Phorbol-ester/DAG-type domain-containing protein n=1 Tax=Trichogramma kaykai TaxID=54128 RepID=A0ABD2WA43_9HYME